MTDDRALERKAWRADLANGALERAAVARALRRRRKTIRAIRNDRPDRMLRHWRMEAFYTLMLDERQLPPTFARYCAVADAADRLARAEQKRHLHRVRHGRVASTH